MHVPLLNVSLIAFFGNNTIWSPNIDSVEKVQRRFTKRLSSLKHYLSNDIRLAKLGLPTLELRRLHLMWYFAIKLYFVLRRSILMIFSHLAQSRQHVDINTNYIRHSVLAVYDKVFSWANHKWLYGTHYHLGCQFSSLATLKRTTDCLDFGTFLRYS